jgi:hypothetical protein
MVNAPVGVASDRSDNSCYNLKISSASNKGNVKE